MVFRKEWILAGGVALGLAIFACVLISTTPPPLPSSTAKSDPEFAEGQRLLQVPLSETVKARADFRVTLVNALKTRAPLKPVYEAAIESLGANGIIETLEDIAPTCHDEGHDLGKVIFDELQDVGASLRTCEDACYSGCMHGVLMEAFTDDKNEHISLEDMKEKTSTLCTSEDVTDLYKTGDCIHGVGHAFMYLADYKIDEAIQYCDLFDSYPLRYYCATGAYMEYVTQKDAEDQVNPSYGEFYPCDRSPYPAACFRYKMTHVTSRLYAKKLPLSTLVSACEALDGKYETACFHGIGNAHMGYVAHGDVSLSLVCESGTDEDQAACIDGTMERLAKFYPENVRLACVSLSGWQKDACDRAGERKMYDLEKSFDLYPR